MQVIIDVKALEENQGTMDFACVHPKLHQEK